MMSVERCIYIYNLKHINRGRKRVYVFLFFCLRRFKRCTQLYSILHINRGTRKKNVSSSLFYVLSIRHGRADSTVERLPDTSLPCQANNLQYCSSHTSIFTRLMRCHSFISHLPRNSTFQASCRPPQAVWPQQHQNPMAHTPHMQPQVIQPAKGAPHSLAG